MSASCSKGVCVFLLALFYLQRIASAAGVVTNCTEVDLRSAMTDGGTVTFACDGTITLTNTLTIATNTILDATGHSITLSGGGTMRVLLVPSGVKLTLRRLTIADGYSGGAGLQNSGETAVADCTFSNNIVASGAIFGGAILHQGARLVVTGTTFVRNYAESGSAIRCGYPNVGNGNISITNCTFYANGPYAVSIGEPLPNPVTIVNCTFAWNTNSAVGHASSSYPAAAKVRLVNSIVAYTVGGEGALGIVDWGHNLSSDNSACLTNATSLRNTDPLLGPLSDLGGLTLTMGLLYGSPAIDAANDARAPGTDQRGVLRPTRGHSDIGAFEGSLSPIQASAVHFTSTNFTAGESQGTAWVQVERSGTSAGAAGVTVSAAAGTASAGTDFEPASVPLVFAEGEMQKSVPIILLDDPVTETNETVILNLSDPIGTAPDSPGTSQLTILDDDVPFVLTDYSDAGLRAAVDNGGRIQFPSNGTITVTSPITVTQFTVLDATGHDVILSGGNAVRLFDVNPGASLTLMNLTIADGRHQGSDGWPGVDGGEGYGGAINVHNGTLTLLGCRFWTNTAAGGAGGNETLNGRGGPGLGGAIYLSRGTLNATNSEFIGNLAMGGPPGAISTFGNSSSSGGHAWGGAIASSGGLLQLDNCPFRSNAVTGGRAGGGSSTSTSVGASGGAFGGALLNDGGTAVVTRCSFVLNRGSTPTPWGVERASGGTVRGGAICSVAGAVSIADTDFTSNHVAGGAAVRYWGTAGAGQGGAVYNSGGLMASGCGFLGNVALAGMLGDIGQNGEGGAIFNAGSAGVLDSTFTDNRSIAGSSYHGGLYRGPDGVGKGGALYNAGNFVGQGNTFAGNMSQGAPGGLSLPGPYPGSAAFGGAFYNTGSCSITNSTWTQNQALGGSFPDSSVPPGPYNAGGDGLGGGICNLGGTVHLVHATLSGNSALGGSGSPNGLSLGGGVQSGNGAVSLVNSIVANSLSGSNGFGTLVDGGHNLSSDSSCNFTNTGSLNNTDPLLYPLGDFGGPTPTMPLLAGSPAIDAGNPSVAPPTDQRGVPRPYGLMPDIGAYEWDGSGPTPEAPTILQDPKPATVFVGESVSLSVTAGGYQPLRYAWRLGGAPIPGASGPAYSFSNAAPSQSGNYTMVVTNVAGAITSAPALVRVKSVQLYHGAQMLTNGSYWFASPPTLTIRSAFTNGSSFYTLDGSPPGFNSTYYAGPFVLAHGATIRAIGYSADFSQVDEADTVIANVLANHTLTVTTTSGGTVSLNPPGGTYIATNLVTATAQPGSGWYFLYWLGDASGPYPSVNVSMERDKTLHAVFGTTLSTTVTGSGSVQVLPVGGVHAPGATLRLTAIPQPGNYFGFWGNAATGNANPLYFTITGPNPTVSSIFAPLPGDQSALTVLIKGHGRVDANPRANAYPTNQTVTLTAVPDTGQSFLDWSGDASGTQNPLMVSMLQSRVITANFSSRPRLRVDRPGVEGLTPEGFRLTVVSAPQTVHQILASTNLSAWTGIGRVTNDFVEVQFTDTNAASLPARFYQAAP